MSIRVMSWVWENANAEGAEMLVLLALADHSDDRGTCYPSVDRIAKRARITDRGAQKAMRSLEEKGLLTTHRNAGPKGCNRYVVNMLHHELSSPRTMDTPNMETLRGEHGDRGGEHGGIKPPNVVHPKHQEPSVKPPENHATPEAIAKGALLLMRVSDFSGKLLLCMTEQVWFESQSRAMDENLAEDMAAAWQKLQASRPKLEYAWGAENFFGQGYWKNEATWPWKQGMAPVAPRPKAKFVEPEPSKLIAPPGMEIPHV